MFSSPMPDSKDLIFQDSTVRIVQVLKENQNYEKYLEASFVRAMQRMENMDCVTAGQQAAAPCSIFIVAIVYTLWKLV